MSKRILSPILVVFAMSFLVSEAQAAVGYVASAGEYRATVYERCGKGGLRGYSSKSTLSARTRGTVDSLYVMVYNSNTDRWQASIRMTYRGNSIWTTTSSRGRGPCAARGSKPWKFFVANLKARKRARVIPVRFQLRHGSSRIDVQRTNYMESFRLR